MIIAVDFDGTVHTGQYPEIGYIRQGCIEALRRLHDAGHYIIIWTCREGREQTQAVNWLLAKGVPFDRINENHPDNLVRYPDNNRKIYADVYVDDRQVGGLPSWDEISDYIMKMEHHGN